MFTGKVNNTLIFFQITFILQNLLVMITFHNQAEQQIGTRFEGLAGM